MREKNKQSILAEMELFINPPPFPVYNRAILGAQSVYKSLRDD